MIGSFMRKALLPVLASLALCGVATAVLVTTTARAQPQPRKPVMVALVTPAMTAAAAAPDAGRMGGPRDMPSTAEIASHVKRMCQDGYARQAGGLAYAEAKLSLTAAQQPLFAQWKAVKLEIAKRQADLCAGHTMAKNDKMPTVIDRIAAEEDMLKRRLADLDAERPVLETLYNSLSPEQKREFGRGGDEMGRRMMMMHHMFAEGPRGGPGMMAPGMMGHGMMRQGPMGLGMPDAPTPPREAPPAPPQ